VQRDGRLASAVGHGVDVAGGPLPEQARPQPLLDAPLPRSEPALEHGSLERRERDVRVCVVSVLLHECAFSCASFVGLIGES